ncbi:MAG: murein biosynthesis integral membrane protein MurJ [Pseudobdellovibrionaceae bacterium]
MSQHQEEIGPASVAERNKAQKQVVLYAISMALGTFSSRILGLLRDTALTGLFPKVVTDAWVVAFRLPNLFRRLLGEGSLSVSFIPIFVEAKADDEKSGGQRAQNLVNSFYTLLLLFLTVFTAVGIIWMEPILDLWLEAGYRNLPGGAFELTVRFSRIMFGFIFLMSNFAFFMGILNALGKYALAAMAPVFFNIAMLMSTLLPGSLLPVEGDLLAWGVIFGGLLQAGILVPALAKQGYLPKLNFNLKNPDALRVLNNMLPGMLGTGLMQITTIVSVKFTSGLSQGSLSYIYLADRLLELPLSLVSVSLGTALLPTLSRMWTDNDKVGMRETANYYLRLNCFVSIPAAIGLFFLASPIVHLLFQRGYFSQADADITAQIVRVYALVLIFSSYVRVLVPSFYAIKNTRFPPIISAVCLVAHIALIQIFVDKLGVVGVATSILVSTSLNAVLLTSFYGTFIGPLGFRKLFKSLGLFLIPSALMAGSLSIYWGFDSLILQYGVDNFLTRAVTLAITIFIGMFVYGGVSYALKLEEFTTTFQTLSGKIRRRFKKA